MKRSKNWHAENHWMCKHFILQKYLLEAPFKIPFYRFHNKTGAAYVFRMLHLFYFSWMINSIYDMLQGFSISA